MAVQNIERCHYGQGEVLAARWDGDTPPAENDWVNLWDVGALSLALTRNSFTHQESRSGKKMEVREIPNGETGQVNATINAINTYNLALLMSGSPVDTASGSVSAHVLPDNVAVGDVILLPHIGVSSVVISDSAGTPAVVPAENFSIAGGYGKIAVKSLPTGPAPTPPLKVAYSYAAQRAVGILSEANPAKIALRYNGINLAENGAPCVVDLWKLSVGVLSELALINNDTSVANMPFTAKLLADLTRDEDDALGFFGQMRYLQTNA